MHFNSLADLLYMDGHGVYVWSCFLLSAVLMFGYLFRLIVLRKTLVHKIKSRYASNNTNDQNNAV